MRRIVRLAILLACASVSSALAEPSALVRLATARQGSLSAEITAYGSVTADPNYLVTIPMPRDARIASVAVRAGETVAKGDAIVTIQNSPAAAVAYGQAASAYSFAAKDLANTRRLYAEQLATKSQLAAAEKAYADAKTALAQQQRVGADRALDTLRAPVAGVVVSMTGSPGEAVSEGTAVAAIANRSRLVVTLGLEPADAVRVRVGALATLHARQSDASIRAPVVSVGAMIDPQSRLVNAIVAVPPAAASQLLVGMTLVGRIAVAARSGIVAPRAAILSDADGTYVFVVQKGIAQRRAVAVSLETDTSILVSQGLKPGEAIVIDGMAGLDSGMAVRTE